MSVGSGTICVEFATLSNPDGSWLKTCRGSSQLVMDWDAGELCSEEFLETWPRSGIVSSGIAYRLEDRVASARPTSGSGSGSSDTFPTPTSADAERKGADYARATRNNSGGDDLQTAVIKRSHLSREEFLKKLPTSVPFPTPTCQDASGSGAASQYERNSLPLNAVAGGRLNADWVELLMGYPMGWTSVEDGSVESTG